MVLARAPQLCPERPTETIRIRALSAASSEVLGGRLVGVTASGTGEDHTHRPLFCIGVERRRLLNDLGTLLMSHGDHRLVSGWAITDAGSEPAAHDSAVARLTYQRLPIRRAGSVSGIRRRIFWQFELADPPVPTSPNHSCATCSTVISRPAGWLRLGGFGRFGSVSVLTGTHLPSWQSR